MNPDPAIVGAGLVREGGRSRAVEATEHRSDGGLHWRGSGDAAVPVPGEDHQDQVTQQARHETACRAIHATDSVCEWLNECSTGEGGSMKKFLTCMIIAVIGACTVAIAACTPDGLADPPPASITPEDPPSLIQSDGVADVTSASVSGNRRFLIEVKPSDTALTGDPEIVSGGFYWDNGLERTIPITIAADYWAYLSYPIIRCDVTEWLTKWEGSSTETTKTVTHRHSFRSTHEAPIPPPSSHKPPKSAFAPYKWDDRVNVSTVYCGRPPGSNALRVRYDEPPYCNTANITFSVHSSTDGDVTYNSRSTGVNAFQEYTYYYDLPVTYRKSGRQTPPACWKLLDADTSTPETVDYVVPDSFRVIQRVMEEVNIVEDREETRPNPLFKAGSEVGSMYRGRHGSTESRAYFECKDGYSGPVRLEGSAMVRSGITPTRYSGETTFTCG